MKKGINRVASAENSIPGIRRICLIGDPGCDGLGAATMSMFARALAFQPADLKFVLGDLVPFGLEQLYRNVQDVIDAVADTPVYALCGNHDTEYYSDYFGLRNYTLDAGNFLIIVLDNSKRRFSAEALALFDEAIRKNTHDKVMVYFHIPPPNVITGNSLAEENWKPFRDIYLPWKDRIGLFACGHVHAYFEDSIDGIPLVVTGGGGARIEFVHDSLDERSSRHHVVSVAHEGGMLRHAYEPLDNAVYDTELKDGRLVVMLEKALANEFAAHFKYRLMAEEAFAKYGPDNPSLAKLF
ncbi:MAG: rubrerythrin family protein, partial [Spirochaetales bacterium]